MSEKIESAIELLDEVISDKSVPKNIRTICESAKMELSKEREVNINVDAAIQLLDELSNDPNVPMHTRIQIWNIASVLETQE